MNRTNKNCSRISANAAYLILLNDAVFLGKDFFTLPVIKNRVEERMNFMKEYEDSYSLRNGDRIYFFNGRWYYNSLIM